MAAFCGHCGGGMGAGAMTCGSCGFSACGGCGTMMAPGLTTCGSCGWGFGRRRQESLTDEVSQYVVAKRTVESLQDHGQGDSEEEEVAEAGMQAAKTKLIVSGIVFVIFVIVMIIIFAHVSSSQNPGGLAHLTPGGLRALGAQVSPSWTPHAWIGRM